MKLENTISIIRLLSPFFFIAPYYIIDSLNLFSFKIISIVPYLTLVTSQFLMTKFILSCQSIEQKLKNCRVWLDMLANKLSMEQSQGVKLLYLVLLSILNTLNSAPNFTQIIIVWRTKHIRYLSCYIYVLVLLNVMRWNLCAVTNFFFLV